jgi:hypothetical protein
MDWIESSVEVECVIGDAFAFFSDPANVGAWNSGITHIQIDNPGPLSVGRRMRVHQQMLGRPVSLTLEVVEFVPPRKIAFKSIEGPFDYSATLFFEEALQGTRITGKIRGDGARFFQLNEPLFARISLMKLSGDLIISKKILSGASL